MKGYVQRRPVTISSPALPEGIRNAWTEEQLVPVYEQHDGEVSISVPSMDVCLPLVRVLVSLLAVLRRYHQVSHRGQ